MINSLLILGGKTLSRISNMFNLGSGSTWPGHIALTTNKNFIRDVVNKSNLKIILIAGTNGKTTTSRMIQTILQKNGNSALLNEAGANLLNGIASSLLSHATISGIIPHEYAIFEVDENSLPLVLKEITPDYLIILNLFRDQLDRYGEVNTIALKWKEALENLSESTTVILNADDPTVSYLGNAIHAQTVYFGLNDTKIALSRQQHAVDSTYCPHCGTKLTYNKVFFSHLGDWKCDTCELKRPKLTLDTALYPLVGTYNRYNTLAAVLQSKLLTIPTKAIDAALHAFKPAFGRQEIITTNNKNVQIFLSKNPTGFNESLRTVKELKANHILIVLNDRIPDGRDISWIWDVDFDEFLDDSMDISVSGDRAYDMSVRLKYAHPAVKKVDTYTLLTHGVESALKKVQPGQTLYVLPTYSAMLETRKILTGKKIL